MENRTYQTDDGLTDPLASLRPPAHWKPDTERAWKLLIERRESSSRASRLRLSVLGITLISVGSILFALPWNRFWPPDSGQTEPTVSLSDVVPVSSDRTDPVTVVKVDVTRSPQSRVAAPKETGPERTEQDSQRLILPDPQQLSSSEAAKPAALPGEAVVPPEQEKPQPEARVTHPVLLKEVPPEYTDEARQARIQGNVEIVCMVNPDGTVKVDRIRRGLGYGLDEKAREAVEQWRFKPATKEGEPVSAVVSVLVNFSLR